MRQTRQKMFRRGAGLALLCIALAGCEEKSSGDVFSVQEEADGDARAAKSGLETEPGLETEESGSRGTEEAAVLYVYVCGQVKRPGVYRLSEGQRVVDALEMAGGAAENASESSLNLAAPLTDGQKIYVPSREEVESAQGSTAWDGSSGGETAGKVNLNTADKETLMTLNGIGETRADSILAYRQEHGPFRSVEEIKNVSGIGDGIFSRIKEQITV